MKPNKVLILAILFLTGFLGFSQSTGRVPQIMITDIRSSMLNNSQRLVLTDLLRTELFKTNIFRIVERGVMEQALGAQRATSSDLSDSALLQLGKQLKVDQLMVVSLEQFGSNRLVVNLRIIEVETSVLSYTENIFLPNQDRLFEAIAEMTKKIQHFYEIPSQNPGDAGTIILARWLSIGTSDELAQKLMSAGYSTMDYFELRQYDISFTPEDYYQMRVQGYDKEIVKTFLQSEIPYRQVSKALALGITSLEVYRNRYREKGFSFAQYLDAYEKGITSFQDFVFYQDGFIKDRFVVGGGGVSNDWPVATADLKFGMGQIAWERFISDYQRGLMKYSWEMGSYFMDLKAPVPYVQGNYYIGEYPFYMKLSVGTGAEVIVGGHAMIYGKLGLEIGELLEMSLLFVPVGTQPKVSYSDLTTKEGEAGYTPINFPYVGFLVTLKPGNIHWLNF